MGFDKLPDYRSSRLPSKKGKEQKALQELAERSVYLSHSVAAL